MNSRSHSSIGKPIKELSALVIGAQRSSMLLTRSMLGMCGVKTVAAFDHPVPALNHLISYTVDIVIIDAECAPISGLKFIKVLRHEGADPLCFVPAIVTCSNPTPKFVDRAMKTGAHLVLHRPFSTSILRDRLLWIMNDKRDMHLTENRWRIGGMGDVLQNNPHSRLLPSLMAQLGLESSQVATKTGSGYDRQYPPIQARAANC